MITYIFFYLINAYRGVPYFYHLDDVTSYVFFLGVFFAIYSVKKGKFSNINSILIVSLYLFIVYLLQLYIFKGGNVLAAIRYIFIFAIFPYLILSHYRHEFFIKMTNIFIFFSIISLIFFVFVNLIPSLESILKRIIQTLNLDPITGDHLLFFSIREDARYSFFRNAGCVSEPGSFGAYLILIYILNNYYFREVRWRKVVLITTIISTFSTPSYIAMFCILLAENIRKINIKKVIILGIIFITGTMAFITLPFLQDKLEYHMEVENDRDINEQTSGRIFGFRKSLNSLKRYPISGYGMLAAVRHSDVGVDYGIGYGFSGIAVQNGVLAIIYWFIMMFRATFIFSLKDKKVTLLNYIGLLLVSFSQGVPLTSPLFLAFLYIGLINKMKVKDYSCSKIKNY